MIRREREEEEEVDNSGRVVARADNRPIESSRQMYLGPELKDPIGVIMSGEIEYLTYLQLIISQYISMREMLFPDVKLRPKHHYLLHYPELILQFGPLIKVWTMRFESKHRFF